MRFLKRRRKINNNTSYSCRQKPVVVILERGVETDLKFTYMKAWKRKNYIYYSAVFLVGLLTISLYACQPSREDNDLQSEHANTYLTEEELAGYEVWEEKETFELAHHHLLEGVDNKIVTLEAYLANADRQTQTQIRQAVEDLQEKKAVLEARLLELKQAKEENWKQIRQEVKQAADSLRVSLEKNPLTNQQGA